MGERWHGLGKADCNLCSIPSAALQQPWAVTLAETIAGRGLSTELREASQGSHLTVLLELRFLQSQGPESTCSNHYIMFHHQEQCPPGAARRLGWGQARQTALPSSGKASQKPPGMPLPQFITKQTQSAAQSKHERESERTSFVCRGRRTVEQRKKQAELSAISCFLGLAPSFLRGGPGRFVLVPSCSSAPLSGGLCRPWRNAALGPQGTWLRAPPAR